MPGVATDHVFAAGCNGAAGRDYPALQRLFQYPAGGVNVTSRELYFP